MGNNRRSGKGAPVQDAPKDEAKPITDLGVPQELSIDVFRSNTDNVNGVHVIRMNDQVKNTKGVIAPAKRDVARILTLKELEKANPSATAAQLQKLQKDAGHALKAKASVIMAAASNDEAVICNRLSANGSNVNINLRLVGIADEATKLHVSTGRPLDECKAFILGQAVPAKTT